MHAIIKIMKEQLKKLLKATGAVKFGEFTLSSGKKSDFYVDCRKVTLHPQGAKLIGKIILEKIKGLKIDAVGGMTMGADPIIGAVITLSDLPGFIVRKKAKEHGTKQKIEGIIEKGFNVLIVEDVATTGASALEAITAEEKAPLERRNNRTRRSREDHTDFGYDQLSGRGRIGEGEKI